MEGRRDSEQEGKRRDGMKDERRSEAQPAEAEMPRQFVASYSDQEGVMRDETLRRRRRTESDSAELVPGRRADDAAGTCGGCGGRYRDEGKDSKGGGRKKEESGGGCTRGGKTGRIDRGTTCTMSAPQPSDQ